MKVELNRDLFDSIIAAYHKENNTNLTEIETLVLTKYAVHVNGTIVSWSSIALEEL